MKNVRFVGLDVHAETIAVAVAEVGGEVRSLGVIPNRAESISRLVRKLGKPEQLRVCYEAGPTGYVLYWQLSELSVKCEVVAPTLVPVKAGDRVKTDRRDAEKLARSYRAGDLTPVWVPDAAHEALRDLVRARLAAKRDQLRARHCLTKFLLRHGRRAAESTSPWSEKYLQWVKSRVHFEYAAQEITLTDYVHEVDHAAERIVHLERSIDTAIESLPVKMRAVIEALQSLRGIAQISAVSIMAEVISKAGNAHLRRIAVEAAWAYRHRPAIGKTLAARQQRSSADVTALAWKAQQRLHQRYVRLMARGKSKQQTVTAVGRELLGFIWAIGVHVEREAKLPLRQAA
jgi:transposase